MRTLLEVPGFVAYCMAGPTGEDVVFDVVNEVAARESVDPTELPPLAGTVDPDALSRLVDSGSDRSIRVEFTYRGYDVTVSGDGRVAVRDGEETLRE